jgi:DNA-nicking Smr family endonuclease
MGDGMDEDVSDEGAPEQPVEVPIDGELDLHLFNPKEVKDLVPDYLEQCAERRIYQVRVIHGKGTGTLLKTVHAILRRLEIVENFELDSGPQGGWGATKVELKRVHGKSG